ncbi:MAG: hypothetical protein L7F78_10935 [Syntrophales bacterium LBB04]|nr:hypothetical protein [Syntrophales bacterium LBB04]
MSKQVAVSFEDKSVKMVYASCEKGRTIIQKTSVLADEDFDSFLKSAKFSDLTVVCRPKRFYSDTMMVPPAKKIYLKKIIESEIRKRFSELKDFSYFYSTLTEKMSGEKGMREIFFFAVDNRELHEITERFNRCGIAVKYLCPDILALSHLIKSSDNWKNKTVLCLLVSETERTFFLVKNGELCFIRVTPSLGSEITDLDIDNINMTVSYCRQNLRLNAELIILMNAAIKEGTPNTIIPTVTVAYPTSVLASDATLKNFITPISAIVFGQELGDANLLPLKYRRLFTQRRVASYGAIFFLLFSLIGLGLMLINVSQIFLIMEKINLLRKDLTEINAVTSAYEKDTARLQQFLPLINLINEARSSPDFQKALLSLRFLPMENVHIQTIQMNNKRDFLLIQISGSISSKNYGEMHRTFTKLLANCSSVSGLAVVSKKIELRNGYFQIDIENRL